MKRRLLYMIPVLVSSYGTACGILEAYCMLVHRSGSGPPLLWIVLLFFAVCLPVAGIFISHVKPIRPLKK